MLGRLVAKQIVAFNDSERSAERGQYWFLQALLRTIAYGTLSRRDRKARHLAAARHLQQAWGSEAGEIAEVLATHYLDAARAEPDATDAPTIRESALKTLAEAGRRAASLALGEEAQRIFDRATELADDDATRASLLEQSGKAAWLAGDADVARERLEAAIELFDAGGRTDAAARATAAVADMLAMTDRLDEALPLAERPMRASTRSPSAPVVAAQLAKLHMFRTDLEQAIDATDEALAMAEPAPAWETIADALITRGTVQDWRGRPEEGDALMSRGLELALRHDLPLMAIRAHNNLGSVAWAGDRIEESLDHCEQALAMTRARGDRVMERQLMASKISSSQRPSAASEEIFDAISCRSITRSPRARVIASACSQWSRDSSMRSPAQATEPRLLWARTATCGRSSSRRQAKSPLEQRLALLAPPLEELSTVPLVTSASAIRLLVLQGLGDAEHLLGCRQRVVEVVAQEVHPGQLRAARRPVRRPPSERGRRAHAPADARRRPPDRGLTNTSASTAVALATAALSCARPPRQLDRRVEPLARGLRCRRPAGGAARLLEQPGPRRIVLREFRGPVVAALGLEPRARVKRPAGRPR